MIEVRRERALVFLQRTAEIHPETLIVIGAALGGKRVSGAQVAGPNVGIKPAANWPYPWLGNNLDERVAGIRALGANGRV